MAAGPLRKQCTKCKKRKKLSEFYKSKNSKSGLTSQCKNCIRASQKGYYTKRSKSEPNFNAKRYKKQKEANPLKYKQRQRNGHLLRGTI